MQSEKSKICKGFAAQLVHNLQQELVEVIAKDFDQYDAAIIVKSYSDRINHIISITEE